MAVVSNENEFFETVSTNTLIKLFIDLCTIIVAISPFKNDRLFYKEFAGKGTDTNLVLLDQMMTIYVIKNRQKKSGKEFQLSSWETKLKRLFSIFKDKGIVWMHDNFGKKNDWLSVLTTCINKIGRAHV